MASALRALAGRIVSGVCQAISATSSTVTSRTNACSLQRQHRLLTTGRLFSPAVTCPASTPLVPAAPVSCQHSALSRFQPVQPILSQVLRNSPILVTQSRSYHVRLAVKRRCSACYFVRRKGRLFVECKKKPRHKQMQMMSKRNLWRDDYSKGNIPKAVFWKYKEQQYYKLGDTPYARHDWLKGKIGVTV